MPRSFQGCTWSGAGAPHGGSGQGLSQCPSQGQAAGGTGAAPASGTTLELGRWVALEGPAAGHVRRELATGPAAALLAQGPMATGAKMGSWAMGKFGERPRGPGQDL